MLIYMTLSGLRSTVLDQRYYLLINSANGIVLLQSDEM